MNTPALKLSVFVCPGGRFAEWEIPGNGKGSILMQDGETLPECFARAMNEARAEAHAQTVRADRFRLFASEALAREAFETSKA